MKSPYRSEKELLDAFLGRQPAAENFIYTQGWLFTRRFVLQNSGSEEDAKDIMQDAGLVFYKRIKEGKYQKWEGASCFTYLNEISKRLWWNKLRKKARSPREVSINPGLGDAREDNPGDEREKEARYEVLDVALNQVGEPCQDIIKLGYYEKLSHKEIAKIYGYTEGYAKKKRHICLEKLMDIYKTLKPGENDQ